MTILTMLIVAVICSGLGFIGGKLYTEKALNRADLQKQIEESQQQMESYRADVSAHLVETQRLMSDMKSNYDSLVNQMTNTSRLLEKPRAPSEQIPYFGSIATDQLMATSADRQEKKRKTESIAAQPSDYSTGPSGLFNNVKAKKSDQSEAV